MKSVSKEDHPDFIGGIVWSRLELEWIRSRDREWETELAAAKSTANNLAMSVMSDQVSNDSHSLFLAAIRDLAAINEHLGLDPDDGGAVPIIEAIDQLREQLAAKQQQINAFYSGNPNGGIVARLQEQLTAVTATLEQYKRENTDQHHDIDRLRGLLAVTEKDRDELLAALEDAATSLEKAIRKTVWNYVVCDRI